ncbi:hypothetical protein PIB30_007618 [Stylosanthes scabra]|uniref:Uncharacterized protein n=1 Tax=Stylosanthes scabra TaxID=79078 RepID=A0ABU6V3P5_9FABA|nr:hypothetical protein [Stylosanthes scabra]
MGAFCQYHFADALGEVDGCFLLELLHRLEEYMNPQSNQNQSFSDDPFLETEEKVQCVLSDTSMLENQIPFIVLKKLCHISVPNNNNKSNNLAGIIMWLTLVRLIYFT